jgi:hypothetical protein
VRAELAAKQKIDGHAKPTRECERIADQGGASDAKVAPSNDGSTDKT